MTENLSTSSAKDRRLAPNIYVRLIYLFFGRFFKSISFSAEDEEKIRELDRKGTIVYIMRYRSPFDFMVFNFIYGLRRLPQAALANDISSAHYRPLKHWVRDVLDGWYYRLGWTDKNPEDDFNRDLAEAVAADRPTIIFLRKPFMRLRPDPIEREGIFETLLRTRRKIDRPIYLVPQFILWSKKKRSAEKTLIDILAGQNEAPGRLSKTYMFWRNFRNAFFAYSEPVEIGEFDKLRPDFIDRQTARKLRRKLLSELYREEKVILGPPSRNRQTIINTIMVNNKFRERLREIADRTGRDIDQVNAEARKCLEEIAADYRTTMIEAFDFVFKRVWERIYEGIVIDREGLDAVRQAAKKAPIVLAPDHRSHADYILLSYIFWNNALNPPHIAAGINLAFWPLGLIFRRAGAFFLRRTFYGDEIYIASFENYLRYLMREEHPIEFFIEGGRSRTGRTLQPKLGMLSMLMGSVADTSAGDLYFIPVGITYEKIIEGSEYVGELAGAEKKKESLGGLIKTPKVLISRYGRVYLNFDDPISYRKFERDYGKNWRDLEGDNRKKMAAELANKISYGFNKKITVTPTALVALTLLTRRKRGLNREALGKNAELFLDFLRYRQAPISDSLNEPEVAIDKALKMLSDSKIIDVSTIDGEKIYSLSDEKRMSLDYYKNTIIHFFVTTSFLASVILSSKEKVFGIAEANDRFNFLMQMFSHEFIYRTKISNEQYFNEVIEYFISRGVIETDEKRVEFRLIGSSELLELFRQATLNLFEAYHLVLDQAGDLADDSIDEKDFIKRTMVDAQKLYALGDILTFEALAKTNIAGAIIAYSSAEVLERTKSGRKTKLTLKDPARREDLLARLKTYLP